MIEAERNGTLTVRSSKTKTNPLLHGQELISLAVGGTHSMVIISKVGRFTPSDFTHASIDINPALA